MTGAAAYGDALFELCAAEQIDRAVLGELDALEQAFAGEPRWLSLLGDPALPRGERLGLLARALDGRVHAYLYRVCALLTERGLLARFRDCAAEYRRRYEEAHRIREAEAVSAVPLTAGQLQRLQRGLAAATGWEIRLHNRVDPALLGGMRLEVGGRLLEGSVRGRLDELRKKLGEDG